MTMWTGFLIEFAKSIESEGIVTKQASGHVQGLIFYVGGCEFEADIVPKSQFNGGSTVDVDVNNLQIVQSGLKQRAQIGRSTICIIGDIMQKNVQYKSVHKTLNAGSTCKRELLKNLLIVVGML